jgi:hypothetical protein
VSSRIGKGPWARALGAALVPDDSTAEAIRGEELWRQGAVEDLRIETGQISARVEGCTVILTAPTIPPRIWAAMTSYARNRAALERAVAGEIQSVQLEHLMVQDWDEPLIPPARAIVLTCACDVDSACVHATAAAYAVAAAIDVNPATVLRWRIAGEPSPSPDGERMRAPQTDDQAWHGARVPEAPREIRGKAESILKRLGNAGIRVADADLADVLATAYMRMGNGSRRSARPPDADPRK